MIDANIVPLELVNSDNEALSFEETKTKNITKFRGVLDPSNLKFSIEDNFQLEGSMTPRQMKI